MSPVKQCRTALGLNESLRESSRQYFENDSRPSGILTAPAGVSDVTLERPHEGASRLDPRS